MIFHNFILPPCGQIRERSIVFLKTASANVCSPIWLSWLPFNFIYPDSYLRLCTYCCLEIQSAIFTRVMHNVIFIGGWNYSHSLRTCKWSQNMQVLVSPFLKDCPGSNSKLFPHYIVQADIFKLSHLSKWLTSSFFFHLFLKEHFPQPLKRFTANSPRLKSFYASSVRVCARVRGGRAHPQESNFNSIYEMSSMVRL